MGPKQQPCRFFQKGRCTNGSTCGFRHEIDGSTEPAHPQLPKHSNPLDTDLRTWRAKIKYADVRNIQDFDVEEVFRKAKELLDSGSPDVQHEVIKSLTEGAGPHFIRKAAHVSAARIQTIATPFLQVLSHADVVSSLFLEQQVGTAYNVLYGLNGTDGVTFFRGVSGLIAILKSKFGKTRDVQDLLAASLDVFARMIALNHSAAISDAIKEVSKTFDEINADMFCEAQPESFAALSAIKSMKEIRIRLGFAQEMPEHTDSMASITDRLAQFQIQHDLPGRLCRTGPRHDNDFEDVKHIQILPTAEEIWSPMSEYLPTKDHGSHHYRGVQALLDRQFRLLREDTVGQLRDSVRQFGTESLAGSGQRKHARGQDLRMNIFENVCITASFFDQKHGLLHLVEFDQPSKCRKVSLEERKRAWQESRHLPVDACVCMVGSDRQVTFFSVVERDPSSSDVDKGHAQKPLDKSILGTRNTTLYGDARRAAVVIKLVNLTSAGASEILARQSRYSKQQSRYALVEFPGILLASFSHTLEALQQMTQTGTLPFSEVLAPTASATEDATFRGQPPRYATTTTFEFDLSSVCGGQNVRFSTQRAFNVAAFSQASGMDESQARAFIHALSNRFALIQGPPGTGKSFVGVQLMRTLLQNRGTAHLGPILCVCYTNHALDQILEHLVDKNVKQIIRVGGRSKSEALAEVNLVKVAAASARTKNENHIIGATRSQLESLQQDATNVLGKIANADSIAAIKDHLKHREPAIHDYFFSEDPGEDGFQEVQHNRDKAFLQWLRGSNRQRSVAGPVATQVQELVYAERQALFQRWVGEIREKALNQMRDICDEFLEKKRALDVCYSENSLRCLQQAHVIGVTTTGLAKNLNLLRKLRSKVLIVEEAGEVLEAHLLPALLPSLEHVIAIGDHQQLRPSIANNDLSVENPRGVQYSLDVSLFERLIYPHSSLPQLPYATLQTQRRMHPSISRLIRRTIYPDLADAASGLEYPEVTSMRHRLFWLRHEHLEDSDEMSKFNNFEVEMTAAVVTHLIKQGTYRTGQVTVLTPYLAQLRKLRRRFAGIVEIVVGDKDKAELTAAGLEDEAVPQAGHRASIGTGLRISTVDNYQGEESDIIVISLVRSNMDGKIGFLKTTNRINVLLSRARHGMYIIGNATVAQGAPMWKQVIEMLEDENAIGPALPLFCPRHPETTAYVSCAEDFPIHAPEGGCNLVCEQRLKCGHSCIHKCHAQYLHDSVICQLPCPRMRKACSHRCKKVCGLPCDEKCLNKVQNIPLPCGHIAAKLECYKSQAPETVKCSAGVERRVPGCGHTITIPCHKDGHAESNVCTASCGAVLPCGHECSRPCSECNTVDEAGRRHTRHRECSRVCERNRTTCSHRCQQICHGDEPCTPCSQPCEVRCVHSKCSKICSEPCVPCAESCAWTCEHQGSCKLPCSVPCSRLPCSERCQKTLPCGHQCPSICGEPCPLQRFCRTCGDEDVLESVIDYIMFSTYKEHDLSDDPVIVPPCGHLQSVSSFDGHMDMKKFYKLNEQSQIVGLSKSSTPFESKDIKLCPTCRGSLRSINRYNRIVKRGLIDEATKRFIVWANAKFVVLESRGHELETLLGREVTHLVFANKSKNPATVIADARPSQVELREFSGIITRTIQALPETRRRYHGMWDYRKLLQRFCHDVAVKEQPFRRVWDLCRACYQQTDGEEDLTGLEEAADGVLNTRSHLLARSLLLHIDLAVLTDFVEVWCRSRMRDPTMRPLSIDTTKAREECLKLYNDSKSREQPMQETEALIYFAFFTAAELRCPHDSKKADALRQDALEKLDGALDIVHTKQSTAVLSPKIKTARIALTGQFQSVVTDEEMRSVYTAMATQFRGTGHWYRCQNGHPFTIGECGAPMEEASCPQCGATIGGRDHNAVQGVERAADIERRFGYSG